MRDETELEAQNKRIQIKKVSLKKFEGLFDSKKELFYRLTVLGKFTKPNYFTPHLIGQVFLPERKFCTLRFMKSLLSGEKRFY